MDTPVAVRSVAQTPRAARRFRASRGTDDGFMPNMTTLRKKSAVTATNQSGRRSRVASRLAADETAQREQFGPPDGRHNSDVARDSAMPDRDGRSS